MSCLAPHAITEFATLGVDDPHFHTCLSCRRQLDQERSLRERLAALPVPHFPAARRREIAAELAALSTRSEPAHLGIWISAALTCAAAAALAIVVAWPRTVDSTRPPSLDLAAQEPTATRSRAIAHEAPPPRLGAPLVAAGSDARLSQQTGDDRDVVVLADGLVEIDTRDARDVDVRVGATVVHVGDAKVQIRAHHRAIVSVNVIVGAAQIDHGRIVVERGAIWTADPSPKARSLRAFRDAWIALRAGRDREAIALFDASTDAAVAEEAAYWAAIATQRAGDDARARFADFVERFPNSPYAAKARSMK